MVELVEAEGYPHHVILSEAKNLWEGAGYWKILRFAQNDNERVAWGAAYL